MPQSLVSHDNAQFATGVGETYNVKLGWSKSQIRLEKHRMPISLRLSGRMVTY